MLRQLSLVKIWAVRQKGYCRQNNVKNLEPDLSLTDSFSVSNVTKVPSARVCVCAAFLTELAVKTNPT